MMTPLSLYLYWAPVLLTVGYLFLRLTVFRGSKHYRMGDLAWGWLANYSLFNLCFVWCWDFATAWRTGVLIMATAIVIGATLGQIGTAYALLRNGANGWLPRFFLGAALLVNIPVIAIVIWRKTQNLPLS